MRIKRRLRNRRGQGLTEYALLICLVSLGLVLLLGRFRNAIGNSLKNSTTCANGVSVIAQANGGGATCVASGGTTATATTATATTAIGNGNNGNNGSNGNNGGFLSNNGGPFIFGTFIVF